MSHSTTVGPVSYMQHPSFGSFMERFVSFNLLNTLRPFRARVCELFGNKWIVDLAHILGNKMRLRYIFPS